MVPSLYTDNSVLIRSKLLLTLKRAGTYAMPRFVHVFVALYVSMSCLLHVGWSVSATAHNTETL